MDTIFIDDDKLAEYRRAIYEGALKLVAQDLGSPNPGRYLTEAGPDKASGEMTYSIDAETASADARCLFEAAANEALDLYETLEADPEEELEEEPPTDEPDAPEQVTRDSQYARVGASCPKAT